MPKRLLEAVERLQESNHRRRKNRALRDEEKKMIPKLRRFFRSQGRAFLREFGKHQNQFQEALWTNILVDQIIDQLAEEYDAELQKIVVEHAGVMLLRSGGHVMSDVGIEIAFDLENPRAERYLRQRAAALVTNVDNTTRKQIKGVILRGVDEQKSYSAIARDIKQRFTEFAIGKPQEHIRSRAELIAVTELGEAYEAGNRMVVDEMDRQGLTMEKSWLTSGDDRVSEGCMENEDAGWIPLDAEFPSGHQHPLRFPGCRCDCLYRRRRS